jgi:hypothetical protein
MQYLKCAAKSVFKPSKIALKRMKFQFRSCGLKENKTTGGAITVPQYYMTYNHKNERTVRVIKRMLFNIFMMKTVI